MSRVQAVTNEIGMIYNQSLHDSFMEDILFDTPTELVLYRLKMANYVPPKVTEQAKYSLHSEK